MKTPPSNELTQPCWEHLARLAKYATHRALRRAQLPASHLPDLMQEALLEAWRACKSFQKGRRATLETWILLRVSQKVRKVIKDLQGNGITDMPATSPTPDIAALPSEVEEVRTPLQLVHCDEPGAALDERQRRMMDALDKCLTCTDKDLLYSVYGLGDGPPTSTPFAEVARSLGVSTRTITRRVNAAKVAARECLRGVA